MINTRLLRVLLVLEISVLSSYCIFAGGFPLQITRTPTNFSLDANTTPPGRLAWLMGNSPNEITNLIELESLPLAQHSYTLNFSSPNAFYRAALMDTNVVNATLAVGANHAVALMTNGIMESWGDNTWDQFGGLAKTPIYSSAACWLITIGYENNSPGPVAQSSAISWDCIAAGDNYTLAVTTNGQLWTWGQNLEGSVGIGEQYASATSSGPTQIGIGAPWRSVFACGESSFAIHRDGTLWAWGANASSSLGVGTNYANTNAVYSPTQVGTASNWVSVAVWPNTSGLGIQSDGSLWAWGNTIYPESVRSAFAHSNLNAPIITDPEPVNIPGPWIGVAPNLAISGGFILLRGDGTLWEPNPDASNVYAIRAYNNFWQDQYTNASSFYNVLIGVGFSPADAYNYTYENIYFPTYGTPPSVATNFPAFVSAVSDANFLQPEPTHNKYAQLSIGVALARDGTVWTMGDDPTRSQTNPYDGPWQRLNSDTDWRYVAASVNGVKAALKTDGSVWVWNESGQLNPNAAALAEPVMVPTNTWLAAEVSGTHVVALDTKSNLWVWGGNLNGQLGTGDYEPRLAPTTLPMAGPWSSLAVDDSLSVAVRQDGTLWAWGNFDNSGTNVTHPVQLHPERTWKSVYAPNVPKAISFCAIAQDGTLWQFKSNNVQQIAGYYTSASPTFANVLALSTNGTLWGWGSFVGFGLTNSYTDAPVQLSGTAWKTVSAGFSADNSLVVFDHDGTNTGVNKDGNDGFGIRPDGTLWAWGTHDGVCQLGLPSNQLWANTNCWTCVSGPCETPVNSEVFPFGTNAIVDPEQIGSDNNWKTVRFAARQVPVAQYTLGLKTDGSLWVWGNSPFLEVTNRDLFYTSSTHPFPGLAYPQEPNILTRPYQFSGNAWSYIESNLGITTTSNLFLWGANANGQQLYPPSWLPKQLPNLGACKLPAVFY